MVTNISTATDAELDELSKDLVWGADAISVVINKTTRQTYYLLENGQLPAKQIGTQWVASKRGLLKFLLEPDAKAS